MNDNRLEQLLRSADQSLPPSRVIDGLAGRVRRRAGRRRTVRTAATILLLVCGIATGALLRGSLVRREVARRSDPKPGSVVQPKEQHQNPPAPIDASRLRAEYARLESEAELHAMTADAIQRLGSAKRKDDRIRAELSRPDVSDELMIARDEAAGILVGRAQRLSQSAGARPAAVEAYQRVITLFPESDQAAVARRRLDQLGT